MKTTVSAAKLAIVREMSATTSIRGIARHLGVDHHTIRSWAAANGIPLRRADPISPSADDLATIRAMTPTTSVRGLAKHFRVGSGTLCKWAEANGITLIRGSRWGTYQASQSPCRKCGKPRAVTVYPTRKCWRCATCDQFTRRCAAEWQKKNPDKFRAQKKLQRAVVSGRIIRGCCEVCGADGAEGHHDDYSKPLDVRWLCRKHHEAHHRELRRQLLPPTLPTPSPEPSRDRPQRADDQRGREPRQHDRFNHTHAEGFL